VNVQTDGFSETGGAAALSAHGSGAGVTFTTVGLRSSGAFKLGGVAGTVTGTLQRHAFGDTVPLATMCFNGGAPFTVAGAPIAKDALMFDAGVDFAVIPNGKLGFSYGGQIADGTNDQFIKGNLALGF
jgi:outer membrane autotransporter protein